MIKKLITYLIVSSAVVLMGCGKTANNVNALDNNKGPSLEPHSPVMQGSSGVLSLQGKSLPILNADLDNANDCYVGSVSGQSRLEISIANQSLQGAINMSMPVQPVTEIAQSIQINNVNQGSIKFLESSAIHYENEGTLSNCTVTFKVTNDALNGSFDCAGLARVDDSNSSRSQGYVASGNFSCKLSYSATK